MTTPAEKVELPGTILTLYRAGQHEAAVQLVGKHWVVFPDLNEILRGDERIAFAAVCANMQIGYAVAERFRKDIRFFIDAFEACGAVYRPKPLSIESPRDLFFMLEYSRSCCHYGHLIGEAEVCGFFGVVDLQSERSAAQELVKLIDSIDGWPISANMGEERQIQYLQAVAPGFSESSYLYARLWISRNITFDSVFG